MALLVAVACVGVTDAKPAKVRVGDLVVDFTTSFFPGKIPRNKPTPIGFALAARFRDVEGNHPPALREFNVETDKNVAVQVKGYPVCKRSSRQARTPNEALAACKKAQVGNGYATIEIDFADSQPVTLQSNVLIFNGGRREGKTIFYVHAYVTVPTPQEIVITVAIRRVKRGRYGVEMKSKVSKIAGGPGSFTSLTLRIFRKYLYNGRKMSVFTLKCPDGRVSSRGEAVFADGTRAKVQTLRRCTPLGRAPS